MKPSLKLILLPLALVTAGCPSAPKLDLPEPPAIDKFTAMPTTVARGGTAMLEWATTNASDVEIVEVGKGPVAGVDNKLSGTAGVTVTAQSLFVLNASNSRGVKVTSIATVAIEGAGQQVMFAAVPVLVGPGDTTTLVWTAPGARTVSISPMGGMALDLRGQVEAGTVQVSPTGPTRYTLTADGVTRTVDVNVTQGITSFTASKSLADAGEMVTLSWQTTNATRVVLNQPGSGIIAAADGGTMAASGMASHVLPGYPAGTVVPYVLTVEGLGPPITETRNVVIGSGPVITSFGGPQYARTGSKFTLRWTSLNADAVELATGGTVFYRSVSGAEAADGGLLLDAPASTTDYTLHALNTPANARASRTYTQQVVPPLSVATFTATPSTVAAGGDPVTLTWNIPGARHLRIVDSDGHSVATARGPTAETGTRTAYANSPQTYTLTADNTIDPAITIDAGVSVTAPAAFGATGTLFANNPFDVAWTVGGNAPVQGYPTATVDVRAVSTGFVDISDAGTRLNISGNDAVASFSPPDFETFMWGTRVVPPFTVSTNGFLVLGPTSATRATTVAMPNTTIEQNFLAAWWADLNMGADSAIFWQVAGEAPERTLIVQFNHMHATAMGVDLVFEIKVHQTGVVTFEYKQLTGSSMIAPVIGVQGPPNRAVAGVIPAQGGSIGFMAPSPSPLRVTMPSPEAVTGFIKLTNGYLRTRFTPSSFVRLNDVAINEVMFSPAPAIATTGEWFEVTNRSTIPVDLAGWSVSHAGNSFVIDAGVLVAPSSTIILGQIERDAGNDDVPVTWAYGTQFALSDTSGQLLLANGGYTSTAFWSPDAGGVGVSTTSDGQGHLVTGDTATTPPHAISCASRTPFGTQMPQQLGSPGTAGYCLASMSSIPGSYFDISATGTPMFTSTNGGWDENIESFSLAGNPFPFLGQTVTTAVVSSNGFVVLKTYTGSSAITNKTAPSTTAPSGSVLSVFWDDLDRNPNFTATANAFYKRVAPGEDPANPGGHWIVQWHHFSHYFSADEENFQVKLFDTGVIEYHFATMTSDPSTTNNYANGNSSTVWLENVAGNAALTFSVNQPLVVPNSAIRFTP